MTPTTHVRRNAGSRVVTLCVVATGALLLPTAAIAADTGTTTVVASINSSGAVTSVQQIGPDGASRGFAGTMPVTLHVTRSSTGGKSTYSYHVVNDSSRLQTVTYVDTAGTTHHTSVTLQLPLVAQLGVTLPSSMKGVTATGATVTSDATGVKHLLWNMVLFTPLGSPVNDVSFTSTGSGTPVAELRATPVDPSTTPGLSGTGQAATAGFQQDDFWAGYAGGGSDGLGKLAAGVGQMVSGLQQLFTGSNQLHNGIVAAQGGAVQLDTGTHKAWDGARALHTGLGQISTGAGALSTGVGKIHTGQSQLSTGLAQLSGGLAQMADPKTGLQAGVVGLQAIQGGVGLLLAGVGPTGSAASPGLLDGLALVSAGLEQAQTNLTALDQGLQCAVVILTTVANGSGGSAPSGPCWTAFGTLPALPGTDPVSAAVLLGLVGSAASPTTLAGAEAALNASLQPPTVANPNTLPALIGGVAAVTCGVSEGAGCPANTPGVKEGLQSIQAGLTQLLDPVKGLPAAVAGATLLSNGAAAALAGSQQLTSGSAAAAAGATKLAAGAHSADTGSGTLAGGLGKLSAGQHKVAQGLPAAVSGTGQLATGIGQVLAGAKQVETGIGQVRTGAVQPLVTQLTQSSQNAHRQLAVLAAAAGLADQAPGGAHASYVLSQAPHGFRLAAARASADHTARNVGVGLGGLVLLVVGVFGGFAIGRRSHVTV